MAHELSAHQLNNVRLFLASPGGVEDERNAVHRLTDELNVTIRRHGWQVEVLDWEDRAPATGRAQENINADVERCDIFLGIVWDRWGTPTGEQSSGFGEEWHLAKARWQSTGKPELWLCFKDIDDELRAKSDDQLTRVVEFRRSVQREEVAFYKTFRSPAELEVAVRRELLDEVLKRAGLSREAIGPIAVDWSAALSHEPVALVRDGPERERLARELAESDPKRAADMLLELANEVEDLGFDNVGEGLRDRAAAALDDSGRHEEALSTWRRLLMKAVESGHPLEAEHAAHRLGERLPPEQHWEARAWTACVEWPAGPAHAVEQLSAALQATAARPVDLEVRRLWRRRRWEICLFSGNAARVVEDARRLSDGEADEYDDDLSLLRAEALSAMSDPAADVAWRELRAISLDVAHSDPQRSGRLTARWGVRLTEQHDWTAAEEAFVRAATLWSRVPGIEEESAECFFSAQLVGHLAGEWIPRGWSWQPLAASLRGTRDSFAARAKAREQSGMAAHADRSFREAHQHFALALAIHRRAGHLRGIHAATGMLADVARDAGDPVEAVLRYCEVGNGKDAAKIAADAPARELTERLSVGRTEWETRAACTVLAVIGRHATEERAAAMLASVLHLSRKPRKELRNPETEAVEALREIAVALADQDAHEAIERLVELLGCGDYRLERSAADGLRMLVELERVDEADALIVRFARSRWGDDVSPHWVAERLDTPARVAVVREAALRGDARAMFALGLAGLVSGDHDVERACSTYISGLVGSNLGHVPDGSGVWGLMALDLMGAVAAYCPSEDLRRTLADMLLVYALETMWPMVNRVSAVRGLLELAPTLEPTAYVDALRPLAVPAADLDETERLGGLHPPVSRGELEATALTVAASLASPKPLSQWLRDGALRARTDERTAVRAAAWQGAASTSDLPLDGAIELALTDSEYPVRSAALHCWRKRADQLPPARVLDRLVGDSVPAMRIDVLDMLARANAGTGEPHAKAVLADEDAFVRRLAAMRFQAAG